MRTRFAPSPTGYLHIGSARTALYCWLYAKKTAGTFILRIEDTDLERSTEASKQAIIDGMQWLELDYDEGPFYQTDRFDRYKEVLSQMLEKGTAYRCYCSKERLETLRATQIEKKIKPRYDGHCRDRVVETADSYVVRFRNPTSGNVEFDDLVRGKLSFANAELDDLIIARSDGSPTYNFTVVVDDLDMQITHVIRGDDHINNTPRQINILLALDAKIPLYAHIPMILGSDGKRLSKRQGAVSVLEYREEGFLPHALLNYLARLGWSHGDQEIFSQEELIEFFDLKNIHRSLAAFNQEKLLWLNQHYLKTMHPQSLTTELEWQLRKLGLDVSKGPALEEVIIAQRERCKTLKEMAEQSQFWFVDAVTYQPEAMKHLNAEVKPLLQNLLSAFAAIEVWEKEAIHKTIAEVAEKGGVKLGKLAQPLRVAVTGGTVSPSIDLTLQLLGREKTLARLRTLLTGEN